MSTKPILVVMAAGMGSRYGGLKQIDPVGPSGEAILDYSLYDARRAGFKTVVFIIKHEIEQAFKEAVGARALRAGFEVRYAYQQLDKLPAGFTVPEGRVKPWGTAHAILVAEEAIGDAPFAVINADDYYGPQGFKLIYDYLSTHADGDRYAWAMVGFPPPPPLILPAIDLISAPALKPAATASSVPAAMMTALMPRVSW